MRMNGCLLLLGLSLGKVSSIAVAAPVDSVASDAMKANDADFQVVSERARELLLREAVPDVETVRTHVAGLDGAGRWGDINYADATPSDWNTSSHLVRVRRLALAVSNPASPLYRDGATEAAMNLALDDWLAHRYRNPNWWHNDIGVPQLMSDIVVLLGDRMSAERKAGALEVWHQYGKAKAGDGANTVWMAELALGYGIVTRDAALVASNAALIGNEIRVSEGEGIQSDGSYHQHGARLQQFHYGAAFINDTARLGWKLRGTRWAVASDKLQIVADCILKGGQWMVRGTATVPGTMDRAASRPKGLRGGDLRVASRFLSEALPQSAGALRQLIARQDGQGTALVGFRSYPRSDFAVQQRPGFGFFLKTVSDRTLLSESINGENLKGHLLNGGDGYFVRDGEEYADMPPVWEWDALPGVTYSQGAGEIVRQPFVGAVSDGASGLSVMDVRFASKEGGRLSARKLWASWGDVTVCLVGDLNAEGTEQPAYTTLDQCRLRGPVTLADEKGVRVAPSESFEGTGALRWIHHAGFAYLPLGDARVSLKTGPVSGAWSRISKSGSKAPVSVPVFRLTLWHGLNPQHGAAGYAVVAAQSARDAENLSAHPTWEVMRNDGVCQAVRFADGTVMAAFYAPSSVKEGDPASLGADAPCLVLQTPSALFACDPTHKGGSVTVVGGGRTVTVKLPASGATVRSDSRWVGKSPN